MWFGNTQQNVKSSSLFLPTPPLLFTVNIASLIFLNLLQSGSNGSRYISTEMLFYSMGLNVPRMMTVTEAFTQLICKYIASLACAPSASGPYVPEKNAFLRMTHLLLVSAPVLLLWLLTISEEWIFCISILGVGSTVKEVQ